MSGAIKNIIFRASGPEKILFFPGSRGPAENLDLQQRKKIAMTPKTVETKNDQKSTGQVNNNVFVVFLRYFIK